MNAFDDALRAWRPLTHRSPGELTDARLQAHWAAQLIEAVGGVCVPAEDDGGHLAMTWLDPLELLAGGFTRRGPRVALRVRDLTLTVLDADDRVEWSMALDGRTLTEARVWLQGVLAEEGETAPVLGPLGPDRPPHPVTGGEPFRLDERAHFEQLSLWLGNCARIFGVVVENTPGASPLRCWPHPFDLATRIHLDRVEPSPSRPSEDDLEARSIHLGLSLGDQHYDEPYLYVTPEPEPPEVESEPLASGGHWHREGFVAAVLPAHRITGAGDDSDPESRNLDGPDPEGPDLGAPEHGAQRQAERVLAFMRSAIGACRARLGVL